MNRGEQIEEAICRLLDGLDPAVVEDLVLALQGTALDELGRAFRSPGGMDRPRGVLARLLLAHGLAIVARDPDGPALAEQMLESGDDLWRLVGQALEHIQSRVDCMIAACDCPPDVDECTCCTEDTDLGAWAE